MSTSSADARLRGWQGAARLRRVLVVAAFALPWLAVLLALAWRLAEPWAYAAPALASITTALLAWRFTRRVDDRWLARRLDARRPDMEDSAALLFVAEASPLQRLQRERLRRRIAHAPPADLRDRWPLRALAVSGGCALLSLIVLVAWPAPPGTPAGAGEPAAASPAGAPALPRLLSAHLEIQPPAYTGLPRRTQSALDARVPEGATVRWTLRFAPQPAAATLRFHDGREVALQRTGEEWRGSLRIDRPGLYRPVLPTPSSREPSALHRIDVVPDRPPTLRALRPASNLSVHAPGQRSWPLVFEAEDDHGLAAQAQLRIIQTHGSGEDIGTRERSIVLRGSGDVRRRRWSHALDPGALGLSPGDDLIVQLTVADNRAPHPQQVRSPSFILRWPPEDGGEATGMDGLVRTTLPAYLRSQRQIIIDAEALLKQKRNLDAARFQQRSSGLGDDQQALRLRYGRFLGEESKGAPTLPTNDLPTSDLPTSDLPTSDLPVADAGHADAAAATETHDNHDGGALPAPPPKFGEAGNLLADFGHAHDTAESATLFDPQTKETLRSALREMWQSELHLRQGDPAAALPYAYRALAFIKEVQQADRLYLARTGIEVPPIDESRRLTGDRAGLADRRDPLVAAPAGDAVPAQAWQALQDAPGATRSSLDLEALERWVHGHPVEGSDPLAVIAAIDALRHDPACAACRARLRAALWPLLPRPPASTGARPRADAAGRAYLQALDRAATR